MGKSRWSPGRGIGRGHALELARRGARIVVNDADGPVAKAVADEISAVGGQAVASHDSVATPALVGLTRVLAVEGRKIGINVNAVAPAAATRMNARLLGSGRPCCHPTRSPRSSRSSPIATAPCPARSCPPAAATCPPS